MRHGNCVSETRYFLFRAYHATREHWRTYSRSTRRIFDESHEECVLKCSYSSARVLGLFAVDPEGPPKPNTSLINKTEHLISGAANEERLEIPEILEGLTKSLKKVRESQELFRTSLKTTKGFMDLTNWALSYILVYSTKTNRTVLPLVERHHVGGGAT